jgi:hypothetical protein
VVGTTTGLQDIQYLGSTAKPNAEGTSLVLPSGLQQNDLVVYAFSNDGTPSSAPSGWTNGQNGSSNSVGYRWGYKFMGATPDTTIAVSNSNDAAITFAFRNVNTTTPLDVTVPSIATATSGMPNPPSITTSTDKSMIVALGFLDDDELNNTVVAQSGYTIINSASGDETTVMASYKVKTPAGADDPAAFTNTGTAGTDSWVGATLALRPATGNIPIFGNFKNSGIWSLSAVLNSIDTRVTVFSDSFETYSGWTSYGTSTFAQSSLQSYDGSFSLYKTAGNGPTNGIYKPLTSSITRGWTLSVWVYSAATARGSSGDLFGIVNNSGNGYSVSSNNTTITINSMSSYSQTLISETSHTKTDLVWYRLDFISYLDNTFQVNKYDSSGNFIVSTPITAANTAQAGPFTRVLIAGGFPFFIDKYEVKASV